MSYIYKKGDLEFKGDGQLKIDDIDYYSIKTYKEEFAYLFNVDSLNNEKQNDLESEEIKAKVREIYIKKCETISRENYPYVNCYTLDDLNEHFANKMI